MDFIIKTKSQQLQSKKPDSVVLFAVRVKVKKHKRALKQLTHISQTVGVNSVSCNKSENPESCSLKT